MGTMRRLFFHATIGAMLLFMAVSSGAQEAEIQRLLGDFPQGDDYFRVFIEQRGRVAVATGGVVSLNRKPFTLVLVFRDPSGPEETSGPKGPPGPKGPSDSGESSNSGKPVGVLVNFSFRDVICSGFREGKSLGEILENPDNFMGMAEHLFNPEEKIVVDDVLPHYLYYETNESHRFSSVTRMNGVVVCRRRIAYYSYLDSIEQKSPVEQIQGMRLFVSLLHSQYGKNYQRIEKQRQCIEIDFRQ